MTTARTCWLILPVLLSFTLSAVAQSGRPMGRPSPSSGARSSPAPSARPSPSASSRPSSIAPRSSMPSARSSVPSSRSQPSSPAPRPSSGASSRPGGSSGYTPRSSSPGYNPPASSGARSSSPGFNSRGSATGPRSLPGTNYRAPGSSSSPIPRTTVRNEAPYTPSTRYPSLGSSGAAVGAPTPRTNVGAPVGAPPDRSRAPVVSTPGSSTPNPRQIYERPGSAGASGSQPIDPRYRSSRPLSSVTTGPVAAQPRSGAGTGSSTPPLRAADRYRSRSPISGAPISGAPISGAPISRQPTAGQPVAGRPVAGQPRGGQPIGSQPRANGRTPIAGAAPVARTAPQRVTPIAAGPRLQPRAANPALQPRSGLPGVQPVLRNRGYAAGVIGRGNFGAVHGPWGRFGYGGWWDPCFIGPRWGVGFVGGSLWWGAGFYDPWLSPWHCGFGGFGASWSLWGPWWWSQQWYWGMGHRNVWWNTWNHPASVGAGFWWYPNSVYCPTFLTVPSTVIVIEESAPPAIPAAAPAVAMEEPMAAPSRTEVLVAGSGPSGRVVVRETSPIELARKYIELGDYYFTAGRFREAADAYARARSYAPDDAAVHFVLADAAFATGDYQFAAFLIGEGLRLDPGLAGAEADKRLFYGDQRQFEEQLRNLDQHLLREPGDAKAHLVRGYNLRFADQPLKAVAAFRRVLELAPDDQAAKLFLDALPPPATAGDR